MASELNGAPPQEMRYIIKRSGRQVEFEPVKIRHAIEGANSDEPRRDLHLTDEQIDEIVDILTHDVYHTERALSVEEIQDRVEEEICKRSYRIFLRFHDYRAKHAEMRKKSTLDAKNEAIVNVHVHGDGHVGGDNEEANQENSNKNVTILSVQRDYLAGEWSREYVRKYILPDDIRDANDAGIIHFHDMDYASQKMFNCCVLNLEDMLQNGTAISGTMIEPPKSFATACTVMSQIAAAIASGQYGGQTMSLAHIAPFVDVSRQKIRRRLYGEFKDAGVSVSEDQLAEIVERELRKEVWDGCQTIQYQLVTLHSTNGQAPFITLSMYLNEVPEGQLRDDLALIIETFLKQRIAGLKDRRGFVTTVAFPKLIYVLQEDNVDPGTKWFHLTELAARCTAKRMVPDYISEKIMLQLKGDVYPPMGCRSFLTPDRFTDAGVGNIANARNYVPGRHRYYGRFNQGVVTLNLVDVACSANGDIDEFWSILDERLDLCHRALRIRHEYLLGTPSDVSPIHWQDGGLARLAPGEPIDKLLYGGYSTISLGYAGLAECVWRLIGQSHTTPAGRELGLAIMQRLNDACMKWKHAEDIDYSVYGTPLESTTYKFAKCLQRRFGVIEHVTDKNYITNSYHVHVTEEIDAFEKLSQEAAFQALSPGGAISYVEVPDMTSNIPAVLAVMRHIYDTILYAELNTKSDVCEECGFEGEILTREENGKLIWYCPNCGNTNQDSMSVVRRTCGYIGSQYWNQGRTQEIAERVMHL